MMNYKTANMDKPNDHCQIHLITKNKRKKDHRKKQITKSFTCLLLSLLLASCTFAPSKTSDGQGSQGDRTQIGDFMEIEAPKQLTLLDNKETLAAEGLYYATWVDGNCVPYENSDGDTVDLYDAQLYLLVSETDDEASAEKNYQTWLAAARDHYEVNSKNTVTCNGQSFTFISYDCNRDSNPYDHGVSALGVQGSHAICAELTCVKDYDKDLEKLLKEFLDGCHYHHADYTREHNYLQQLLNS